MERLVTVVGKDGVEYTVLLTSEQTDYYLRLAQVRASNADEVMREFSTLIIEKCQEDGKDRYN